MATENPAFAGGQDEAAAGGVDIEAGLRDGTMTAEQAVVLLQEQLRAEMQEQMDAKIAAARLGVAEGGTTLAAAVRGVVARLTETPTNFHQATVHFLAACVPARRRGGGVRAGGERGADVQARLQGAGGVAAGLGRVLRARRHRSRLKRAKRKGLEWQCQQAPSERKGRVLFGLAE